jgi:hypothetical protein
MTTSDERKRLTEEVNRLYSDHIGSLASWGGEYDLDAVYAAWDKELQNIEDSERE